MKNTIVKMGNFNHKTYTAIMDTSSDELINSIKKINNLSADALYVPFLDLAVHLLIETKIILQDPLKSFDFTQNPKKSPIQILTNLQH